MSLHARLYTCALSALLLLTTASAAPAASTDAVVDLDPSKLEPQEIRTEPEHIGIADTTRAGVPILEVTPLEAGADLDGPTEKIDVFNNFDGTFDFWGSDGDWDNSYKLRNNVAEFAVGVQTGRARIVGTLACFRNTGGRISNFTVGFGLYTDGPGRPEALAKHYIGTTSLPSGSACLRFTVDGSVTAGTDRFWVSTFWDTRRYPNVFVRADENGATKHAGAYRGIDPQTPWAQIDDAFPRYRGLDVGVIVDPLVSSCRDSTGIICLERGRFQVIIGWTDPTDGGRYRPVNLIRYSDTSALGYFKNPSNVELLVKTVNGCGINGRKWVFIGGVTNQNVSVLVTDVLTGESRYYENTRGQSFFTVTDTDALPSC